jgi:hypothetical protein
MAMLFWSAEYVGCVCQTKSFVYIDVASSYISQVFQSDGSLKTLTAS